VKSKDWKYYKQSGVVISILLRSSILASVLNQLENSTGQEQQKAKGGQKPATPDVNFSHPLNSTINLGTPFLVQYDNTTSVNAIGNYPG
jgi:hypothetical protein